MAYLWLKAIHLIGVVAWFAGLFYLVRLFVYHAEARDRPEAERAVLEPQFAVMERRLYGIIATPAMIVAVASAAGMLLLQPTLLRQGWLHAKLLFVALLLGYHVLAAHLTAQFGQGKCRWSGQQLRALNEVPTLLLVAIVLLAVFKTAASLAAVAAVVVALGILLAIAIRIYQARRARP